MVDAATLIQLDERIASIRENLRDLIEQAAARSGAGDESRADDMIAAQEDELAKLVKEREDFGK
jgi:hypothetical protein